MQDQALPCVAASAIAAALASFHYILPLANGALSCHSIGMKDELAVQAAAQGDDDAIRVILVRLCQVTQMGFAAVARVTEDRWIACQVLDKIAFGLEPGAELEVQMTICNDIRQTENYVVIDHVDADIAWQRHPVPRFYGFKSYASFPLILSDGSFYGTLCAIDPEPRLISDAATVATIEGFASDVSAILSAKLCAVPQSVSTPASRPQAG